VLHHLGPAHRTRYGTTAAHARHRPQGPFGRSLRKLATLDRSVIAGKLGEAPADWLRAQRAVFFGVFGFDRL